MKYLWMIILVLGAIFLFSLTQQTPSEEFTVHYISPSTDGIISTECSTEPCKQLLHRIANAQSTIEFAIYGIREQDAIVEALTDATKRGVEVRGIVDRKLNGEYSYSGTPRLVEGLEAIKDDLDADRIIESRRGDFNGRPRCKRPNGFEGPLQCLGYEIDDDTCLITAHASREDFGNEGGLMHNKFFVVDGEWVWTGSTNLSNTGTGGYNANVVAEISSTEVAKLYQGEFEQMFSLGKYHTLKEKNEQATDRVALSGGNELEILFSPQAKPMKRVVELIANAKDSINVTIFFLTQKEITRQLIKAHRRGVAIRIILDATAAKNGYQHRE